MATASAFVDSLSMICTLSITSLLCLTPALSSSVNIYAVDTIGWENLQVHHGRRVTGVPTWVDQRTANARACLKMCWLYSACTAVTFRRSEGRCQIYRLGGDSHVLRTKSTFGALVVDMTGARIASSQGKYGCNTRPCKRTEMCAPMRNTAHYVCISLIKESSQVKAPNVPNSVVHFDGLNSMVYACEHGYFRRGSSYISSFDSESLTWSPVDISCTFVDCGPPPTLHGARASGTGTFVGSEVTYSCLAGAVPSTDQITVTCEGGDGQWSPLKGSCAVLICGLPPALDNMDVKLTQRSTIDAFPGIDARDLQMAFGGAAEYKCKSGYSTPVGATFISQCEADGTWSSTANFRCSPVDCGLPPHVSNASHLNFTGTTLGENVTVTCLPGFAPLTGLTLTCDSSGAWLWRNGRCELIDCGDPLPVASSTVHFSSTVLNSEATYECDDATVVIWKNNSTSKCEENGEWSPVDLQCTPVPCGAAPPVDNSSITYELTNEDDFDAIYSCDAGYVFTSFSTRLLCDLRSNTWKDSVNEIKCDGVYCGPAPQVNNAIVQESGRNFPAHALYICNTGFTLSSNYSTRTCNPDGLWSTDGVVCDRERCGTPTLPNNAVASPIGVALHKSYSHGETVIYSCENGHVTVPSSSTDSQESITGALSCSAGDWIMEYPEIFCGWCNVPPSILNATWRILATSPSTVDYTCDMGYNFTLDSVNSVTCHESSGEWRRDGEIHCERVNCGEPLPPRNGSVSLTGTMYNDTATYSCDSGFRSTVGDSARSCGSYGRWSGSMLECEEWTCASPTEIVNSTTNYTSLTLNSNGTYTCDDGLGFLKAASEDNVPDLYSQSIDILCSDERIWINSLTQEPVETMQCTPVKCSTPPMIRNAIVRNHGNDRLSEIFVETEVEYECQEGYRHKGLEPKMVCLADGTWSFPFFECLKIDCGLPQPLLNAEVRVENETIVGSTANYTCNSGHSMISSQWIRVCQSDGAWSNNYIECTPDDQKHCGDPPALTKANFEVYSLHGEWTALYTCADNYEHSWSNTLDCFAPFYYWMAAPVIECRPADCGQPPNVDNAQAFFTETTVGSTVIYRCFPNSDNIRVFTKTCTTAGGWPTEPLVECIPDGTKTCGAPPKFNNSQRTFNSTTVGSTATYICEDGYSGPRFKAVCDADGVWQLQEPNDCTIIVCGAPPAVRNTEPVVFSGDTNGSVAVYKCVDGYKHTGTSVKVCEAHGMWSPDIVECVPENTVLCGDPPKRYDSNVWFQSRVEKSTATYSCKTGYTGADNHSVCNSDGRWSESHILCERIQCSHPKAIANATISLTSKYMPVGRSVVHSCHPGHTSSTGSPLISTCLEYGTWSPLGGTCEMVEREDNVICSNNLPTIANGKPLSVQPAQVGDSLIYICNTGYFPMPSSDIFAYTCLSLGIWSTRPLYCFPSLCVVASPPKIANADYKGIADNGGSPTLEEIVVGLYSCIPGFTTDSKPPKEDGSNTTPSLDCNPLTGWPQHEAQTCRSVDCGNLELPTEYAVVSPSYSTSYMSQVEISCRPPFFQNISDGETNKTVVCNATGDWSLKDTKLLCTPCNQMPDFPNGAVELRLTSADLYSDKASLRCNENYHLIGRDGVHCGSLNGSTQWIGLQESRCVQNVWYDFDEGYNGFYKFDIYMDAVTVGFSACAKVTYSDKTRKLQIALKEMWSGHTSTPSLLIADLEGTRFSEKLEDEGDATIVAETNNVFYATGSQAYVCVVLDVASQSYTFVNNNSPQLTMPASAYKDLTTVRVGQYVTLSEVHILYNSLVTRPAPPG